MKNLTAEDLLKIGFVDASGDFVKPAYLLRLPGLQISIYVFQEDLDKGINHKRLIELIDQICASEIEDRIQEIQAGEEW